MPVQDFLPATDVKHTIKKEVKEKLKLKELVTIESPGKPMPADSLIDNREKKDKKIKKRKTIKVEADKIDRVGDYILIITEKPQAAQKISSALGNAEKYSEGGVSYYEVVKDGKNIIVASAVGHLFNLEYVKGQKGWPIFNIEWRPSFEREQSAFTRKYYFLLKKLSKKASEVVIATDYDVEGEVIGWNVLRFICNRDSAKRMKYSTLTKEELKRAFENPMQNLNWGQAYAGETRHILDWLYGINLSRALMSAIKRSGSFKILSIGRVQGPTLKIIVDREREISDFKPEPYWHVFAYVNGHRFKYPRDIFDKNELKNFEGLEKGIAETKEFEEKISPPEPFDLTTLQKEAYRIHKISPSQTLIMAQKLYLNGLISYPRTSSQKIPFSIAPKKILNLLEKYFPLAKEAKREKPIEGKKSDPAHPSIYPTGEFEKLGDTDKKLYELIVNRFISVFSDDAETLNKKVKIVAEGKKDITFTDSGLKIKERGWMKVYPSIIEEKDVPTLNGLVNFEKIENVEKETQPPKRYTPASLISVLEKKNLGTKATRSTIVDTLFERGYLDGRSIKATPLGIKLIESLEKHSPIIIDENLTRQLEEEMEKIQESSDNLQKKEEEVVRKAERLITDIAKEFKANEIEIGKGILKGIEGLRNMQDENNHLILCPKCKKGMLRIMYSKKVSRRFVACSAYPNCDNTYTLPPNAFIKKSGKECQTCKFPKLLAIRKEKRPWEFCFNSECEEVKRLRAEWEKRKRSLNENNKE